MTIASLTYRHSIGVPHWNDVPNWNARAAARRDLWRFHAALAWHALCPDAYADRLEDLLPAPLVLTFVSTVAFAIQLLIFAYLYSSHRVRFFQYLLVSWGAYTLSKGLKLVDVLVLDIDHASFATEVSTIAAVGLTLAAAFAHRWDYRLRG